MKALMSGTPREIVNNARTATQPNLASPVTSHTKKPTVARATNQTRRRIFRLDIFLIKIIYLNFPKFLPIFDDMRDASEARDQNVYLYIAGTNVARAEAGRENWKKFTRRNGQRPY